MRRKRGRGIAGQSGAEADGGWAGSRSAPRTQRSGAPRTKAVSNAQYEGAARSWSAEGNAGRGPTRDGERGRPESAARRRRPLGCGWSRSGADGGRAGTKTEKDGRRSATEHNVELSDVPLNDVPTWLSSPCVFHSIKTKGGSAPRSSGAIAEREGARTHAHGCTNSNARPFRFWRSRLIIVHYVQSLICFKADRAKVTS